METVAILKIKKIKCANKPVYDITVPNYNNFILSNGLVVHNCKPYQYLKNTIYEERIELPENTLLQEEFLGLQRDSNGKVDHDPSGINSKDSADAVCGSVWNASQNAEQYAYDFGESLDTVVNVSSQVSMQSDKKQLQVELEQELTKMLDPITKHVNNQSQETVKQNTDTSQNNNFKPRDFGLGPAQVYKPAYLNQGIIFW